MENDGYVTIPEFPQYEMNLLERVREVESKRLVYKRSSKYYSLWQDGKLHTRSSLNLVRQTFPGMYRGEESEKK